MVRVLRYFGEEENLKYARNKKKAYLNLRVGFIQLQEPK
jgi:hypothetical protein